MFTRIGIHIIPVVTSAHLHIRTSALYPGLSRSLTARSLTGIYSDHTHAHSEPIQHSEDNEMIRALA